LIIRSIRVMIRESSRDGSRAFFEERKWWKPDRSDGLDDYGLEQ